MIWDLSLMQDKVFIFCGDVERPNGDVAYQNLNWMDLMTRHFEARERIRLEKAPGILAQEEWVRKYFNYPESYNIREITKAIEKYGKNNIIVWGYEIPKYLLDFLTLNNILHIITAVSPVRFCPDLYLSVRSNFAHFTSVPDTEFKFYASCLKARPGRKLVKNLQAGTTLIVGQSKIDSSLVGQKENGEGYIIPIDEINWKDIPGPKLFKPHPGFNDQTLAGVPTTNENIYDLLCMDEITTVAGVSSSALGEAECFGKKVIRRLPCLCSPGTGYTFIEPGQLFGCHPKEQGFFRRVHWAYHPSPEWPVHNQR